MSAIMGTFVKIGTMADGTPRLVLDLQCTLSEVAAMGLIPGVPFALARLEKEVAGKPVAQEPKERAGVYRIMACNFSKDPQFHEWLNTIGYSGVTTEGQARAAILDICGITSRKDLDSSDEARHAFLTQVRTPFFDWREG